MIHLMVQGLLGLSWKMDDYEGRNRLQVDGNFFFILNLLVVVPYGGSSHCFMLPISLLHHRPPPLRWHKTLMTVVCLSVCPMPDHKSKMERRSKLKIGRKEAHGMGDL